MANWGHEIASFFRLTQQKVPLHNHVTWDTYIIIIYSVI